MEKCLFLFDISLIFSFLLAIISFIGFVMYFAEWVKDKGANDIFVTVTGIFGGIFISQIFEIHERIFLLLTYGVNYEICERLKFIYCMPYKLRFMPLTVCLWILLLITMKRKHKTNLFNEVKNLIRKIRNG